MVRAMVDNLVRARVLDMMARRMPHLRRRALGKLKAGRILEFRAWLTAHKDLVGPDRADLRRHDATSMGHINTVAGTASATTACVHA